MQFRHGLCFSEYGDMLYRMEIFKMSTMIDLFLVAYLLAMVLVTILGVIGVLTVIFSPEWLTRKGLFTKYHKK
ncbi:MAG: hypothetical protein DRQ44_02015 [Gammaproteobacteria bacterium]|nr:MAG: hypothetical protein DRQ44_02015 [Gammaproteobacteria bacterium]